MAIEKFWREIPDQFLLSDGGAYGEVEVPSTRHIKVKEKVTISSTIIPHLLLEVKLVKSPTQLILGPPSAEMQATTNLTTFTVATGAKLSVAKQKRPGIDQKEFFRSVFDEEPTVAIRNVLVDEFGEYFDSIIDGDGKRRLAVDTNVSVTGISVDLDALSPPNQANPDNVLIVGSEDGTKAGFKRAVKIQPDSALNMVDFVNSGTSLESDLDVGIAPVELKVGATRLANRRSATLNNTSNSKIYWGYTSSVTTSSGTPITKKQQAEWNVGDNQSVFLVADTNSNLVRITEGA